MKHKDVAPKLLEEPDLMDDFGEKINANSNADMIIGLLAEMNMDSVDLQHAARDLWAKLFD